MFKMAPFMCGWKAATLGHSQLFPTEWILDLGEGVALFVAEY